MTSKNTPLGGGLNLAVRRGKPNQSAPASIRPKSQEEVVMKQKVRKQMAQEKKKAAEAVENSVLTKTAETAKTHKVKQPSSSSSPKKNIPKLKKLKKIP